MKKLFALVLSCAMMLGLAATAFAADEAATQGEGGAYTADTEIEGPTTAPIIKVMVPTTGSVVVNPYKMNVSFNGEQVTDQILSADQFVLNQSNVDISVSVSITATVGTDVVLSTSALKGTETTKSIYLYFQSKIVEDPTYENADSPDYTAPIFAVDAWGIFDKANSVVLTAAEGKTASLTKYLTIPAATYVYDEDDATVLDHIETNGALAFHLAGAAATAPTVAWTDADTVDVVIAFTFTAVAGTGTTTEG